MAELFSVNFVLFISTICNCSIFFLKNRAFDTPTILTATPGFLALVGFLVILKDVHVIPSRYKIHNWVMWLPLETIICLAFTEFVMHVIWFRIEEVVETFVKVVLMENNTTMYYDAGGDSLVNFVLMIISGAFLAFAVCITGTHVTVMNSVEVIYERILRFWHKMKEKRRKMQERKIIEEAAMQEEEQEQPQMVQKQCITVCSPELFDRIGELPSLVSARRADMTQKQQKRTSRK